MSKLTKIAEALVCVQTLSYYDFPLMEHMRDPATGQDFILAWVDEDGDDVIWHTIPVSPENLEKYLSEDPAVAITFKALILASQHLWRCRGNTYDYASILEGERITHQDIPNEVMPTDDAYHHYTVMEWHEKNGSSATREVAGTNGQSDASSSALN